MTFYQNRQNQLKLMVLWK